MPTGVRSAEPTRPASRRRWVADSEVLVALGAGGLAVAAVLSPEHAEDGPVICPFRRLTGLPCPGCGLTRSWIYLVHGWWRESLAAHPFGVVAVAFVLVLGVAVVAARLRGRPAPDLAALVRRPAARAVLAAWLVFAVVRLVLAL